MLSWSSSASLSQLFLAARSYSVPATSTLDQVDEEEDDVEKVVNNNNTNNNGNNNNCRHQQRRQRKVSAPIRAERRALHEPIATLSLSSGMGNVQSGGANSRRPRIYGYMERRARTQVLPELTDEYEIGSESARHTTDCDNANTLTTNNERDPLKFCTLRIKFVW